MSYSSAGIIALLVNFIINNDVFKTRTAENKAYRRFLFGVTVYYIADALWGILYDRGLIRLVYADTVVYFAAMALAVLWWTQYVIDYLKEENIFKKILFYTGRLFLVYEIAVLIANFFKPIVFSFDENGTYITGRERYITLFILLALFFLTFVYTLYVAVKTKGRAGRRYVAIALFGFSMIVLVSFQVVYPLLPLYSIGFLLGTCLLHTFVIGDEKEERRKELEEALAREKAQKKELGSARHMAYTDPLTGIKNKNAYMEHEAMLDERIADGSLKELAIVFFDLNGLKNINDTKGHECGDNYIKEACGIICDIYKKSEVYRIGGDEFVALVEGEDYKQRNALLAKIKRKTEENLKTGGVVIAAGMAEYVPGADSCMIKIFEWADRKMYEHKYALKEMRG